MSSFVLITPDMKFRDITKEEIKTLLPSHNVTEQSYNKIVFKVYYGKPKMKASQIMAMKRTGIAPAKNVENTNKLVSMLARKVIEGDAIVESSVVINDSSVGSIIGQILESVKKESKDFAELVKDPRMHEAFNTLKAANEAQKNLKKDAEVPEDIKKAINEVRNAKKK